MRLTTLTRLLESHPRLTGVLFAVFVAFAGMATPAAAGLASTCGGP